MNRRDLLKTLVLASAALGLPLPVLANDTTIRIGDKVTVDLDKVFHFIIGHPATPKYTMGPIEIQKDSHDEGNLPLESIGFDDIPESINDPVVYAERICDLYEEAGIGEAVQLTNLVIAPHFSNNIVPSYTPKNTTIPFWKVKFPKMIIQLPKQWKHSAGTEFVWNTTLHPSFLKKV